MRLVQITIPSGKRETLLSTLDDEEVDYVVADETSGREYAGIAYIPLPTNAVEPVLESLREAGLDDSSYTVVMEANTVVSRKFDELEDRYSEEPDEDQIARDELVAAADSLAPSMRTYVIMTIVSALVATAGLLLDSAAVVVGSMVIAPLVGPAMAASVGTVVNDREMFIRGVWLQILGLLLAIGTAFVFAFVVRQTHLVPPLTDVTAIPEVRERVAPDFLSLVIAIGAGVAGIVSLTTGVSAALVGVMIAVALIPPAATVGIGLAWGQPMVSLSSVVLVLVNVLSINLAALVVLWYSGYRPEHWFRRSDAKRATIKRIGALVLAIAVLSVFLVGVTLDSMHRATTEEQIQEETTAAIESIEGDREIEQVSVTVEYPSAVPFEDPERAIITVGVPPGETATGLASEIKRRVEESTNTSPEIEVRYISIERE
ncbi:TIGR00341 family protein [Halovenus sp. HT40]|uniref:TIGR00341 family protein n=1 Tax=Halovenus sp. HT40 TaxID=3126691 RepID=UPI00300F386A